MSELVTPRKRGRPPNNTASLGEMVKRRKIGGDVRSSPFTPKALEAPRNAAASSSSPASRTVVTRQGNKGHSTGASQENNTVAADLADEESGLSAGDPSKDEPESLILSRSTKANRQKRPKIEQQSVELNDTIIIARERRQGRPREPKTTKKNGPNRNEPVGNGLLAADLLNAGEDGRMGAILPGAGMQYLNPQEVSETATKRQRGRPRKSDVTNNYALGNENGTVDDGQSASPDTMHDSVSKSLRGTPTKGKSGRLQNILSNRTDSFPGPADGQTPTKRKPGRPRKVSVNQSENELPSNDEMPKSFERPTSHENTPTKHKRGKPRNASFPESEIKTYSIVENGPLASEKEQPPSDTVVHSGKEHLAIRRSAPGNTFASENRLVGIMTPPRRRGRPQKTVNFEDGQQIAVDSTLGFKDIIRKDVAETAAARDTDSSITSEGSGSPNSSKSPIARRTRGRPRKSQFPLPELPPNKTHSMPLNSENISEPNYEDDLPLTDAVQVHELAQGPVLNQKVEVLKRVLLEKLAGKRGVHLVGLDNEQRKVCQIVEQTVLAGEGNSMLVVGARGSGKSTLVEKVISQVSAEHREDFHTVRLNGFIHTDDRLALREIWRQLGIEMEVEEELTGKASNYADILSSLLALLSHPSEISESAPNHTAKSVIFILNEFDLFASHPRQTLLYNLFDIAQGRKAPVLVLGLTTKIDVVESLEKRVKSRFSHRHVHLSLPKSLGAFWEICKQVILISKDDIQTAEEKAALIPNQEGEVIQIWNSVVEGLGNDPDFKRLLQSIFYTTKGVKDFHVACLLPIINLSPQSFYLKGQDFIENSLAPPESKLHILEGLSDLELSLLIAAARLDIILDTDTCNFNMAYDEYTTLASRVKLQSSASGAAAVGSGSKIWGREVGLGAWERLAEYSLIVPAVGGTTGVAGGNGTRDVGRMGRMFRVDVGLEEIWQSLPSLGGSMTKWCREI